MKRTTLLWGILLTTLLQSSGRYGLLQNVYAPPFIPMGDSFGFSMATKGENLIVGAPGKDDGETDAGAAYMFNSATLELIHVFTNPRPTFSRHFGWAVGFVGSNVVVGAPGRNVESTPGAAYLFNGTTGELLATLENPTQVGGSLFGSLVGSGLADVLVGSLAGVYVFNGTSGELVRTIADPAGGRMIPGDFDVRGNSLLVGSLEHGVAYLVNLLSGEFVGAFDSPSPEVGDLFGSRVGLAGGYVLVADPFDDSQVVNAGAVYVFDGLTGELVRTIRRGNSMFGDFFGGSLAFVGTGFVTIGATVDERSGLRTGVVFLFSLLSGGLLRTLSDPNPAFGNRFGASIDMVGLNIIVGAPGEDSVGPDGGAVYVFNGLTGRALRFLPDPVA